MTLLGAQFYVEVHGLFVTPQVLGQTFRVDREGEKWQIAFPTAPDSFDFMRVGPYTDDPRDYSPTVAVLQSSESMVQIRLVRVVVNVESSLSAETYDETDSEQRGLHHTLFSGLHRRAVELVAELCERVRMGLGHDWIEPMGEYPRVVNLTGLVDVKAQQPFGGTYALADRVRIISDVVTPESLPGLREKLRQGPLNADELLLGEAMYLAQAEQPVGPDRATLLAAIAIELRTKRLLQALAEPDRVAMLELLSNSPRDWSMSAHGLFLKAIPVMLGQEASERHKALARKVQSLFTARNGIVHKGGSVSREDAGKHIQTAREALAHMDELTPRSVAVAAGFDEFEGDGGGPEVRLDLK